VHLCNYSLKEVRSYATKAQCPGGGSVNLYILRCYLLASLTFKFVFKFASTWRVIFKIVSTWREIFKFVTTCRKKWKSHFYDTRCITPKRVTSWWGSSPRHVEAVANHFQHDATSKGIKLKL